jgi:hypothetical protein
MLHAGYRALRRVLGELLLLVFNTFSIRNLEMFQASVEERRAGPLFETGRGEDDKAQGKSWGSPR